MIAAADDKNDLNDADEDKVQKPSVNNITAENVGSNTSVGGGVALNKSINTSSSVLSNNSKLNDLSSFAQKAQQLVDLKNKDQEKEEDKNKTGDGKPGKLTDAKEPGKEETDKLEDKLGGDKVNTKNDTNEVKPGKITDAKEPGKEDTLKSGKDSLKFTNQPDKEENPKPTTAAAGVLPRPVGDDKDENDDEADVNGGKAQEVGNREVDLSNKQKIAAGNNAKEV